jgi:putative ABC transport system permease protein
MLSIKLAFRNLMGAGLRTWLNVIVLSFSFVVIVWHRGLLEGWNQQAKFDTIKWEIGNGTYWQVQYDPYDPFSLDESHAKIPEQMLNQVKKGNLAPILITQATIYPSGHMQTVLLKGIQPDQKILALPTAPLDTSINAIPAVIGSRMAKNTKLKEGDFVTVRWRDVNGVFDADEIKIVDIFKTNVPAIDNGQIWLPLEKLRDMTQMPDEATIIVTSDDITDPKPFNGWEFKNQDYLLAEITEIIHTKSIGGSIIYIILLLLAMLAIFDTQVLSIFRRQKEIGMHMALGMTRGQVIRLFTVEGALHGILAAIVAAIYGIPLLYLQTIYGIAMPEGTDDYGLAISEKIIPVYSFGLILGTTLIVLLAVTIVSFLPTRKIAKMKPTDAIRGKVT